MKLAFLKLGIVSALCLSMWSCEAPKKEMTETTKEDVVEKKEEKEPSYAISEGHAKVWNEAIKQVMELADVMPEDQYGFRPHDSIRTFAEQLVHIGTASKTIAGYFLKDAQPSKDKPTDVATMSKEDIKVLVRTHLEEVGKMIKSMSDEQLLNEEVKSFSGQTMTRLEGMLLMHDHLTNHKAKANLYVRINNLEPPRYRYY